MSLPARAAATTYGVIHFALDFLESSSVWQAFLLNPPASQQLPCCTGARGADSGGADRHAEIATPRRVLFVASAYS